MRLYEVSLNVVASSNVSASLLADLLEVKNSDISGRVQDDETLWTVGSEVDRDALLEKHIQSLFDCFATDKVIHVDENISKFYLSVAVYYDTATCTVSLASSCLNQFLSKFPDITLEITCYPCEDTDNDD